MDIERLKVDREYWDSVAPEGATHWDGEFLRWTGNIKDGVPAIDAWDRHEWSVGAYGYGGSELEFEKSGVISRPEPKFPDVDWTKAPIEATYWLNGDFVKFDHNDGTWEYWEDPHWVEYKSNIHYKMSAHEFEESGAIPRPQQKSPVPNWDTAPSLATHWDAMRGWWVSIGLEDCDYIHICDDGAKDRSWQPRVWLKTHDVLNNPTRFIKNPSDPVRPEPLQILQELPKQLDQSVFDGLPSEYRWAAVDIDGTAYVYTENPFVDEEVWSLTVGNGAMEQLSSDYDATNWKTSLIERQAEKAAVCVDKNLCFPWKCAPEGTTNAFLMRDKSIVWVNLNDPERPDLKIDLCDVQLISKYPEPEKYDAQKTLEEAQECVDQFEAIQKTLKYPHYFKDVSQLRVIDVYRVLSLFEVTNPCLQHIVKKALCAGKRGSKDFQKDCKEIADTALRLIEMGEGK